MKKIVVTGADGFIGRNLCEAINSDVIGVDLYETNPSKDRYNAFEFLEKLNSPYFGEINAIFHNGACSDTMCYDLDYMNKHNFDYSKKLLDICLKKDIKLIYASSASIYGDGPFIESFIGNPKNIYANSKFIFDLYASQFIKNGAPVVGLRYFNVYGKYEEKKGNMASVFYKFFNQIKSSGSIKLFYGSENFFRDFVYIDDIIDINLKFLNSEKTGIFNAGSGRKNSFLNIAEEYKKYFEFDINYIEFPKELSGKYQKNTVANLTNLKNNISFESTSLSDGIRSYLEFLNE